MLWTTTSAVTCLSVGLAYARSKGTGGDRSRGGKPPQAARDPGFLP